MPCTLSTLYVIQCETPRTYYVGSTANFPQRFQQHLDGYGSKWTSRHGCKKLVCKFPVPTVESQARENDVWMMYAHIYGPERVRGGDVTVVQRNNDDSIPDYLLPECFGGERIVDWGFP